MAKRVEGHSDRRLECAMAEFMEMGYQEASLRVIAAKAETATGSIYTRFKDKEGLYHALPYPGILSFPRGMGWFALPMRVSIPWGTV